MSTRPEDYDLQIAMDYPACKAVHSNSYVTRRAAGNLMLMNAGLSMSTTKERVRKNSIHKPFGCPPH